MAQPVFFILAGFSPNVGTCRGKSGLEFRVFRRAAARPYVRGVSAGHDVGSPSLVFLAMSTP